MDIICHQIKLFLVVKWVVCITYVLIDNHLSKVHFLQCWQSTWLFLVIIDMHGSNALCGAPLLSWWWPDHPWRRFPYTFCSLWHLQQNSSLWTRSQRYPGWAVEGVTKLLVPNLDLCIFSSSEAVLPPRKGSQWKLNRDLHVEGLQIQFPLLLHMVLGIDWFSV